MFSRFGKTVRGFFQRGVMCGVTSAEFTHLTADDFENFLAKDDVFTHYFNVFLNLPCFPKALLYNRETGVIEVASGAAEFVSSSIRSDLQRRKSQLLNDDPTSLARSPLVNNCYTVSCLDKEQGLQWVLTERVPFFLKSDCFSEYRLAKLLFQWDPNPCTQRRTLKTSALTPHQRIQSSQKSEHKLLKAQSPSQENISTTEGSVKISRPPSEHKSSGFFSSCSEPEDPHDFSLSTSNFTFQRKDPFGSQTDISQYITEPSDGGECHSHSSEPQLDYMAAEVVQQVLNNALNVISDQSLTSLCRSEGQTCGRRRLKQEKEGKTGEEEKTESYEKNREVGIRGTDQESAFDMCCHGPCCHSTRPCFDEFKEFLQGTPGEKLLNLWMDIERLKATQNRERKKRYVVLMRSCYLQSSSHSRLHVELLSRLGLSTSPCWTEEKLCSVQPELLESLLTYWVPRFWTFKRVQKKHHESAHLWQRAELCVTPLSGMKPIFHCSTLPPLSPDCPLPQAPPAVHTQLYSSSSQLLSGRRMEEMLQALYVEPWAGFYFTNFCEQSGIQLWENAVNFWTDLQHYRELFCQDGLDPYRVQREAQLLYSCYICSSARRSIGVDEKIRKEVYNHMNPGYEELFDHAEEHTLSILLEPWTLSVSRDTESFQKVQLQEELRYLDSQEYRELQSLYKESKQRLHQVEQCGSMLSSPVTPSASLSKGSWATESWSRVPPNYQGYRLGSLLRHRHEIGHFMSFLQNQNASVHLMCWLDLDQYKRTLKRDTAVRQERSLHIVTKYLNEKYFFGPDSPATVEQQNEILRFTGGLEHLQLECISNPIISEIQDIVRSHIEKTWLPVFLSTAEFTERQKHQPEPRAAERFSLNRYRRHRTRREAWKAEGLWMSSSKEILLFRRILLNPVTCLQFQYFVCLKGDFLENDLLFWLEVQRYKDLCHSHSDEATIQLKISTIINCFINSSMPPALQIDIPPEQAQHILEKRRELGPYIFREAQMTVFSELLKFWPEFKELSSSVQQEHLLPILEEKRVAHRARVRRLRRKEEEEEERIERRRAQLESPESSQEENETDDDNEEAADQEQRREKPPTQWLSWSYSKYMAALKKEEMLLKRQSELEASFSTSSDQGWSITAI